MQNINVSNLQDYFTGRKDFLDMFNNFVSEEKLSKHLFVIYWDWGMGKSSLMQMFYFHCKDRNIPIAMTSADNVKSIVDLMKNWSNGLNKEGITLHKFSKTLKLYETIIAKMKKDLGIVDTIISKGAEVGTSVIGSTVGSVIPIIGTITGGVVGGVLGMTAEAINNWRRNHLSKDEDELFIDPAEKLTVDFLEDIAKFSDKKRIVLLLDTFEKINILWNQFCNIVKNIHKNVLVVISGRVLPEWNRSWFDWRINTEIKEITNLSEDDTKLLISRFYKSLRGKELNPEQIEQIIKLKSSLPLFTTIVVNLLSVDGNDDFKKIKSGWVVDVLKWLMEDESDDVIQLLEVAAITREFDEPILGELLGKKDVRDKYRKLSDFSSFVKKKRRFACCTWCS